MIKNMINDYYNFDFYLFFPYLYDLYNIVLNRWQIGIYNFYPYMMVIGCVVYVILKCWKEKTYIFYIEILLWNEMCKIVIIIII